MTPEKVKDIFKLMKLKSFSATFNHEKLWNGASKYAENNPEWGKFDLDTYIDGDDYASFLLNLSKD